MPPQSKSPSAPSSPPPQSKSKYSFQALGRTVRALHPGQFDDVTDDEVLGRATADTYPDLAGDVGEEETALEPLGEAGTPRLNLTGGRVKGPALGPPPGPPDEVKPRTFGQTFREAVTNPRGKSGMGAALALGASYGMNLPGTAKQGVGQAGEMVGGMTRRVGSTVKQFARNVSEAGRAPTHLEEGAPTWAPPPSTLAGAGVERAGTQLEAASTRLVERGRESWDPRFRQQAETPFTPEWALAQGTITTMGSAPLMAAGGLTAGALGGGLVMAGGLSGLYESWGEGEDAYRRALASGVDEDEANRQAQEVFLKNLPFTVTTSLPAFGGFGATAFKQWLSGLSANFWQEYYQNAAQESAFNKTGLWSELSPMKPTNWQAATLGGIVGGIPSYLGGAVEARLHGGRPYVPNPRPGQDRQAPPADPVDQVRQAHASAQAAQGDSIARANQARGIPPPLGSALPSPGIQGSLPYAAGAGTLFGEAGTVNDQPVLGLDAQEAYARAVAAGEDPDEAARRLSMGGASSPVTIIPAVKYVARPRDLLSDETAPDPNIAELPSPVPDLLSARSVDEVQGEEYQTEAAIAETVPEEHQSLVRRALADSLVPFHVGEDGTVWAHDHRANTQAGRVVKLSPDPEPSRLISRRFLSPSEVLGLRGMASRAQAAADLVEGQQSRVDPPSPEQADYEATQAPLLLNDLLAIQGFAPGDPQAVPTLHPREIASSIDDLLERDRPSLLSDQFLWRLRQWQTGTLEDGVTPAPRDLKPLTLHSWAALMQGDWAATGAALTPQERVTAIARDWGYIAKLAEPPAVRTMNLRHPVTKKSTRVRFVGPDVEAAERIRLDQALSPKERQRQYMTLAGWKAGEEGKGEPPARTPDEKRAAKRQTQETRRARASEVEGVYEGLGWRPPDLEARRERARREIEEEVSQGEGPESHEGILNAVAEYGPIDLPPRNFTEVQYRKGMLAESFKNLGQRNADRVRRFLGAGEELSKLAELADGRGRILGRQIFHRLTMGEFRTKQASGALGTLDNIVEQLKQKEGFQDVTVDSLREALDAAGQWAIQQGHRPAYMTVAGRRAAARKAARTRAQGRAPQVRVAAPPPGAEVAEPAGPAGPAGPVRTVPDEFRAVPGSPEDDTSFNVEELELQAKEGAPPGEEPDLAFMRVGPARAGAKAGTSNVRIGGVSEKGLKQLATSMYREAAAKIIPRELAQNSIDEVISAHPDGSGVVHFRYKSFYGANIQTDRLPPLPESVRDNDTWIEVGDNGRGLSLQQIETVFTEMFESGKDTDPNAAGGFGMAKAVIFQGGSYTEVETTVDETDANGSLVRMTHRLAGTPDQFRSSGGVPVSSVRTTRGETGTRVRVYFPDTQRYEAIKGLTDIYATNVVYSREMPLTMRLVEVGKEYGEYAPKATRATTGAYAYREKPGAVKVTTPGTSGKGVELLRKQTDYGEIVLYKPEEVRGWSGTKKNEEAMRQSASVTILNNGRIALPEAFSVGRGFMGPESYLPEGFVVDVRPGTITEDDPKYPFTTARDALKGNLEQQIKNWIDEEIVDPAVARATNAIRDAFHGIRTFEMRGGPGLLDAPVDVAIFDPGGRWTDSEIAAVEKSTVARPLAAIVERVGEMIRTLYPDLVGAVKKIGIMVHGKETGGLNIGIGGEYGLFFDLSAYRTWILPHEGKTNAAGDAIGDDTDAGKLAWALTHMILHEVTHLGSRSEGASFTAELAKNYSKLGGVYAQYARTLLEAIRDPGTTGTTRTRQDLLGLVDRILDRTGRATTRTDILSDKAPRLEGPHPEGPGTPGAARGPRGGPPAGPVESGTAATGVDPETQAGIDSARADLPPEFQQAPLTGDAALDERIQAKREAVSKALGRYFTSAGMFNLEEAPALLKATAEYGAALFQKGVTNLTKWEAAMRARHPHLVRAQTLAIYHALRNAGGNARRAIKELSRTTTPHERAQMRKAKKSDVGLPPPSMANQAVRAAEVRKMALPEMLDTFGEHLDAILELVDWARILRIEGNTDTRFRVFRQIAQQILMRREFDPIWQDMGLVSRQQLAELFEKSVTGIGTDLGKLGDAVTGNWGAIEHLPASMQPKTPEQQAIFERMLEKLYDPNTLSLNMGGMFHAVQGAASQVLHHTVHDPVLEQMLGAHPSFFDELFALQSSQPEEAGVLTQVTHASTSFMLAQFSTAAHNFMTFGVRMPLEVFTHASAAVLSSGGWAAAKALNAQQTARTYQALTKKHGAYAGYNARLLGKLLYVNAAPKVPWGDTLQEIFQLSKDFTSYREGDIRRALQLVESFPKHARDLIQFAAGTDLADPTHRGFRRFLHGVSIFNREQEFFARAAAFDASLRAEFARKGVSYQGYISAIQREQDRIRRAVMAGTATPEEVQALASGSSLFDHILQQYWPNRQELDDAMLIATTRALTLTYAGKGLTGGIRQRIQQAFSNIMLLQWAQPFMRFAMTSAQAAYNYSLVALPIDVGLFIGSTGLTVGTKAVRKMFHRPGAPEDRRTATIRGAKGFLGRSLQSQKLEYRLIPRYQQATEAQQHLVTAEMATLTGLKQAAVTARRAAAVLQHRAQRAGAGATIALPGGPPSLAAQVATAQQAAQQATSAVAQQAVNLGAQRAKLREFLHELTKAKRTSARLNEADVVDAPLWAARSLAAGALTLGAAYAIRSIAFDDSEWYEIPLPGKDGEPTTDLRKYIDARFLASLAAPLFLADLMVSMERQTDWGLFWDAYEAHREENPHPAFRLNALVYALRTGYHGRYRQEKLLKDAVGAWMGLSRAAGTQEALMQLLLGEAPNSSPEGIGDALVALAMAMVARYTVPLRMARDFMALWDEDEAKLRIASARQTPDQPYGPAGKLWENVPILSKWLIPDSVNAVTGEVKTHPAPGLRALGLPIKQRTLLEREFMRTGLTPQETLPRLTGISHIDNLVAQKYAGALKDLLVPIIESPDYQKLSMNERRQFLTGMQIQSDTIGEIPAGAKVTTRGVMPDLRQVAMVEAMDDLEGKDQEALRARGASPKQAADFRQWYRRLEREWQLETQQQPQEAPPGDEDEDEGQPVVGGPPPGP